MSKVIKVKDLEFRKDGEFIRIDVGETGDIHFIQPGEVGYDDLIKLFADDQATTLEDLREGAVFVTEDGVYAVKSEYRYENGQCQCILLASGEYAHFADKNETIVYEVIMPQQQGGYHEHS